MKSTKTIEKDKTNGSFWLFGGLLCVLLASIMGRDINRPFIGLHSWGQAHEPWVTRVHLKYGLGYTKGLITWAVGDPPTENPARYLNHPQLSILIDAAFMGVLGIHDWSLRVVNAGMTILALLLLLKILRGLLDEKTALLAGLFFVLYPLTGYFGVGSLLYPLVFLAFWCYLVLIDGLRAGPQPSARHKWGLALGLFFALQMSWEGFFFALAIGVHYVARCIWRRQFPNIALLAILVIAPLSSLLLNFVILAAGRGWDFKTLFDLYKWRAGPAELAQQMPKFDWGQWFAQLWEHAATNFSLPVLIIAIIYLTFGQLLVLAADTTKRASATVKRRFPHFCLFLLPAAFQLFLLKGALWKHQTWERPLAMPVAMAAALGIMMLGDQLAKIRPKLARQTYGGLAKIATVVLVAIITISCAKGLNYYYSISHFSPARVKLFKMLNQRIPPDNMLLSFETQKVEQHEAKGSHYRPEIAWYLDREVIQATSLAEIQKQAQTGRFPYYLIPAHQQLAPLINQLRQRYKFESVPADPGGPKKAPMLPYLLFNLRSRTGSP